MDYVLWCRSAIEINEQHDAEVSSAREAVEEDVMKSNKELLGHFESELSISFSFLIEDKHCSLYIYTQKILSLCWLLTAGVLEHERECKSEVLAAVEAHSGTLRQLHEAHNNQAEVIQRNAHDTFQDRYMVSQPSHNHLNV